MKRLAILPVLLPVLVAAVAQSRFTYRDASGDMNLSAAGGKVTRLQDGFRLNLKGQVNVTSKSQGLTVSAETVEAVLSGGSSVHIKNLTATGNFSLTKAGGGRSSRVTGSRATLTTGASQDRVAITGPVTLVSSDSAKRQLITATGSGGSVVLAAGGADQGRLRSTSLTGPVKVTLVEHGQAGDSRVVVSGSRLDLVAGTGYTLTVRGNVGIRGEGASTLGTFSNLATAIFTLNAAGEVTAFETEAG